MTLFSRHRRVFAAIGLALLLAACSPVPLYTSLDEQQANELMAVLLDAGVDARKARSADKKSWSVSVRNEKIPLAMKLLTDRGLPQERKQNLGQVFEKKGFVSSGLELKARYLFGLSQELEQTLIQVDDVVNARVHIALPERDVVKGLVKPSSASVVIIARNGAEIIGRETDIKAIVKDSIEGLDDINKVTVQFFTSEDKKLTPVAEPSARFHSASLAGFNPLLLLAGSALVLFIGGPLAWYFRRRAVLVGAGNDQR